MCGDSVKEKKQNDTLRGEAKGRKKEKPQHSMT